MNADPWLESLARRHRRPAFVDEVGLGAIAFELVACAVILPYGFDHPELDDSKKLKHEDVYRIAREIRGRVTFSIGTVTSTELREIRNMAAADDLAMRRAIDGLPVRPDGVFVDGNRMLKGLDVTCYAIPKGDALMRGIAAASIIAKEHRDRTVAQAYGEEYEEYGVKTNFGYKSPKHLDALRRLGPTEHHRIWMPVVKKAIGEEEPCRRRHEQRSRSRNT